MRKQILKAVAPLVTAFFLVGVLLFSPLNQERKYTSKELDKFATSLSTDVYVGQTIKRQAFANKKYLPLIGSSELSRFDPFHPSVLAKKYHRDYMPFLIGKAGTQSLAHYFYLNELGDEMKNRKMVFILSPQWFELRKNKEGKVTSNGIDSQAFANFVSMEGIHQWMKSAEADERQTQFLAKRLLKFPSVTKSGVMDQLLTSLERGDEPAEGLQMYNKVQYAFNQAEDSFFQRFQKESLVFGKKANIQDLESKLPETYHAHELDLLAKRLGEEESSQNDFWINNKFYNHHLKMKMEKYKNFQVKTNFLHGVEYHDFQLLLNLFAKNHDDVLFVIPPVNRRWTRHSGLKQSMLTKFADKVKRQLNSQGFDHVVNYVNRGDEPYFMNDTIHLGKRGWVALDQEITKFMKNKKEPGKYKINNQKFLSQKWLDEN